MTIDQLINRLTLLRGKLGGSTPVLVDGYEAGLDDIVDVETLLVVDKRTGSQRVENWEGRYEDIHRYYGEPLEMRSAVALRR